MELDRSVLDRVVAIINGKGGVLKTTITTNVGGMLAASGFKTLIVDLDPQGNAAEDLGYDGDEHDDAGRSLFIAMTGAHPITVRRDVRPNLDVAMGGHFLTAASATLGTMTGPAADLALAKALESVAADYDLILIDCPPGDEKLQTNALAAARWALIPVKSDKSSRKGLEAVAARIAKVEAVNPDLDLLGIVLTDLEPQATVVRRVVEEAIADIFKGDEDVMFTSTIRHSTSTAQQARERGQLVVELEKTSKEQEPWWKVLRGEAEKTSRVPASASSVARDLHGIATELVARLEAGEAEEVVA